MFLSLIYSFYNIRFGIITLIYDKTKMLILSEFCLFYCLLLLGGGGMCLTHFSPVSHFYTP